MKRDTKNKDRTQTEAGKYGHGGNGLPFVRKIQAAMLPGTLPLLEELEIGACCFPGSDNGSDLYDIFQISENELAFLLFDVEGGGMRAALVGAMAKICFAKEVNSGASPFTAMERVNGELCRLVGEDLHLSVFLGYLDLHDNELTYCTTGTVFPILFRRETGRIELLKGASFPFGVCADTVCDEERIHLVQGDCLVLFTDGLYRLFPDAEEESASSRSERFVRDALRAGPASELVHRIRKRHAAHAADDDVSIIYAEVLTQSRKNQLKVKLGFLVGDIVYLQFLNYLEEMDRTTATILSAMDNAGYADETIRKMKIVLTELLVNAVVHGNGRNHTRKVVVGHFVDRKQVTVSILDEGTGFDPTSIPDPTLPENLEKPCGRGLYIVQHYVESMTFNKTGNRVTIRKLNDNAT